MLEILASWIINFISTSGYLGVFFLMLIESALIPMPSEVTMPFSGFLVQQGKFNLWIVVFAGTLGNLFGSLLAYFIGSWGQETVVRKLIRNWGKYVLISEHEFNRSEKWFLKYGELIVFASRLLPAVRTYISLPAGIAKMNLTKFVLYTTLGSFIWSLILAYIGVILGSRWTSLSSFFHSFDAIIVIAGVVLAGWYIKRKIKKHQR
ncbi:DedA family protein [Candidatus Gottesmanbacteria bacterium]|nr:DedA family protein [Candidatus Gottesmanbacteria bacterium]